MRLGIVTDVHLCPAGTPPDGCHNPYAYERAAEYLNTALERHRADDVDALAVLGDLTNGGDAASLARAMDLLAHVSVPVFLLAGNHDRDQDPEMLSRLADGAGNRIRMVDPNGERFAGFRVAGLQITTAEINGWSVENLDMSGWSYEPTIVLCHLPLINRERAMRGAGLKYAGGVIGDDRIAGNLIDRGSPTLVIHGHLHVRDAVVEGPVLQIGCAALIEPPYERVVFDLESHDGQFSVHVTHSAVAASPAVKLPVMSPAESFWTYESGSWTSRSRILGES